MIQQFSFKALESIAKLIDDDVNLLDVNQFCVAKAKERFVETRNKKDTITRIKKAKTKFIKRDLFNFEYVNATIKVLRNNKRAIRRDNNCDKVRQKKSKKLEINIVATIDTNI